MSKDETAKQSRYRLARNAANNLRRQVRAEAPALRGVREMVHVQKNRRQDLLGRVQAGAAQGEV